MRLTPLFASALVFVCACRARGVAREGLERAIASDFANLVATQEARLGLPAIDAQALSATASCFRPAAPASGGPGDWRCTLRWVAPRHRGALFDTYEVLVTPGGCFTATADAAEAHVGGPTLVAPSGASVPNLLFVFDGCIDTR